MHPDTKHIALLCENQKHASAWLEVSKKFSEPVEMQVVENLDQLMNLVQKQLPDIIILSSNKPDNSVITYLKDIRHKDGQTDGIPILSYTAMPAEESIENLFRTAMEFEHVRSEEN